MWNLAFSHNAHTTVRQQKLAEDNLISEVKDVQLERGTDFLADKQNRTFFRSRPPMRWKALLELVHTDVCQVDTKSHAGLQYFVTFIDDHSRKLWVSPLKTKDQIMPVFKEFHARVERETNGKLKVV